MYVLALGPPVPVFRAACSVEDGDHTDRLTVEDVEDPVGKAVECGSADAVVYAGVHLRMLTHSLESRIDLNSESVAQAGVPFAE